MSLCMCLTEIGRDVDESGCWSGLEYGIWYNYLGMGADSTLEMAKRQRSRKAKAKQAHLFVIIVRLSPERV